MYGERVVASVMLAGLIFTASTTTEAATVNLPTGPATLYLEGAIQSPVWVTFSLNAQVQLQTTADPEDQPSFYILNVTLAGASDTTTLQFAEIEGAIVENGLYETNNLPGLLFSDSNRTLQINPSANFHNATLLNSILLATLPEGLSFRLDDFESVTAEVAQVTNNPIPAAAPLFASGVGAFGIAAWYRRRKMKISAHNCA